jgi:hypothetical protein
MEQQSQPRYERADIVYCTRDNRLLNLDGQKTRGNECEDWKEWLFFFFTARSSLAYFKGAT